MNKLKNNLSTITFFVVVFLINIFICKTKGIANIDFLWIFGSSRDILSGMTPYTDFNIILFPIFYASMAPFSGSIMSFYIAGSVIYAFLATIIFRYLKDLRWVLLIFILAKIFSMEFWEYNMLMIFFIVFSFITLKEYYKTYNNKHLFLTGILLCLGLLTKQNVPGIIIPFLTIFIFVRCLKDKKYKDFGLYALGGILPAIILVIWALFSGCLKEMIDLTILGIADFIAIGDLHSAVIICYVLVLFLSIAVIYLSYKQSAKDVIWAFIYIIGGFQIIRVADLAHIIHGALYWGLLLLIILQNFNFSIKDIPLLFKKNKGEESFIVYICCVFILIMSGVLTGICSFINYNLVKDNSDYYLTDSVVYEDVRVDKNLRDRIESISEYIKSHPDEKIVVMSETARAFSLYLDEHWGVIDMNLLYNGGVNGREKIIDKMHEYDKVVYYPTDSIFIDIEIYKYIKDNFEICDTIKVNNETFNVYEIVKVEG